MTNVLVIGMLDSIHLSRWLSQFEDQSIMFTLYPSRKFRNVHPDLIQLTRTNKRYRFAKEGLVSLYGYKEFFYTEFLARFSRRFSSEYRLSKIIKGYDFDYIHVLEIQGAGYLLLDSHFTKTSQTQKIIVTNWGSDIYYFENNSFDKERIRKVLSMADYYSAECHRDYELALKNGFLGKFLPINPNAGGFKESVIERNMKSSNDRKQIIAKCYGGEFGLGEIIVGAIDKYFQINKCSSVFFYSVTPDLEPQIKLLMLKYPNRVTFSTVKNKLSILDMYEKFASSRIYVGASRSDGISTSFLEALALGAYPIQTNTSCANEWLSLGFEATLVSPNINDIFQAITNADNLINLEDIRKNNKILASKFLSFESIKQSSIKFYERS